jgi:hypothetical protein
MCLLAMSAFNTRWNRHDEWHHHFRRYTPSGLSGIMAQAGYSLVMASYFNTLMFPIIAALCLLRRLQNNESNDLWIPPAALNKSLAMLLGSESFLLKFFSLPVGISLIPLARKPQ